MAVARVKKILTADEDLGPVSNHASFVIAKGAVRYLGLGAVHFVLTVT